MVFPGSKSVQPLLVIILHSLRGGLMLRFTDFRNWARTPERRDRFWRRFLAPSILIVVALYHASLVWRLDQSSWGAGCGFGMFATVDAHGTRCFRLQGNLDGTLLPIAIDGVVFAEGVAARITPTRDNLIRYGHAILRHPWELVALQEPLPFPSGNGKTGPRQLLVASREEFLRRHPGVKGEWTAVQRLHGVSVELRGLRMDLDQSQLIAFPKESVVVGNVPAPIASVQAP